MKNNEFLKQIGFQQQMQDAGNDEKPEEKNVGWVQHKIDELNKAAAKNLGFDGFYGKKPIEVTGSVPKIRDLGSTDVKVTLYSVPKFLKEMEASTSLSYVDKELIGSAMLGYSSDPGRVTAWFAAGAEAGYSFDEKKAVIGALGRFDVNLPDKRLFAKKDKKTDEQKSGTGFKLPFNRIRADLEYRTTGDVELDLSFLKDLKNGSFVGAKWTIHSENDFNYLPAVTVGHFFGNAKDATKDVVKEFGTEAENIKVNKKTTTGDIKKGVKEVGKELDGEDKKGKKDADGNKKAASGEKRTRTEGSAVTTKPEESITPTEFTVDVLVAARDLMKLKGNQSEELTDVVNKEQIQYQGKNITLTNQDKALLTKIAADIKLEEKEVRGVDGNVIKEVSEKTEKSQIKLLDALIENIDPTKADSKNDKKADKTLGKALKDQKLEEILAQDTEVKKHIAEWKDDAKSNIYKEAVEQKENIKKKAKNRIDRM